MTSSLMPSPAPCAPGTVVAEVHTVHPGSAPLLAQLRSRAEIRVVDREDPRSTVALVVADAADETLIRAIRRLHHDRGLAVVLIIAQLEPRALLSVVESGVCTAVPRADATTERVVRAVQAAARRHGERTPRVLARPRPLGARGSVAAHGARPFTVAGISRRERAVLELVADGRSTREIAITLSYSERTIKNILQELTTRLHLRNRTQAVAYALRSGWI
jgi:DNA-binding NarL/FixJ family response regulator